ncbi:hypothetical protein [Pseudomonas koreensis]|uniref:hypothetical protein n=1 Tax=Pseudomonas koreensis TaxID=198620 RepID=UPI0024A74A9D|nr:hypothetical protein [Pseudomonas koreensis]
MGGLLIPVVAVAGAVAVEVAAVAQQMPQSAVVAVVANLYMAAPVVVAAAVQVEMDSPPMPTSPIPCKQGAVGAAMVVTPMAQLPLVAALAVTVAMHSSPAHRV